MKKLMKSSLVALSLTAAVLGLTGCKTTTSSTSSSAASDIDPTKAVTVTWWNNYQVPTLTDDLTEAKARASSTYREYYYAKDLIAAFETEHPNITVNQVYKGSYSEIATAVNTAGASGDTPSMCSVYGDNVAVFNNAGLTQDMTSYVSDADIGFGMKTTSTGTYVADSTTALSDYNQNYLNIEKGMYGGKYLSMPYSKSAETLVVNQTVFDKVGAGDCGTSTTNAKGEAVYTAPVAAATKTAYTVPTTWKDLINTATQMKTDFPTLFADQRDSSGYFKAIPFCWDSAENMFISLCQNLGIKYTDGTGATASQQVLFNNADAKKMVVQLKKWNNEGLICTQNQLPLTNASKGYHDYSSNKAVAGTVFMCMSSTAGARYFATDGGFEATLNQPLAADTTSFYDTTKAATVTDVKKVISQGPSLTFFKKSDVNETRAAWEFYKYLTSTDNTATLAKNTAYFPLRTSSYNSDSIKALTDAGTAGTTADAKYAAKGNAYTGEVLNLNTTYTTAGKYFLSDVFTYSSACRTAVGNIITTVFNDKTATTDDAIATLVDSAFTTAYAAVLA
jgi:ABC-type glycerol-3-phosphate transport system substrate-binding protein